MKWSCRLPWNIKLQVFFLLLLLSSPALASDAAHAQGIPFKELALKGINLLILVGGLAYLARNSVRQFFAERRAEIDSKIHDSGHELEQAKDQLNLVEKGLSALQETADAIVKDARESGTKDQQQIIARAKQLAETIKRASRQAADTEETSLRKQLIMESLERAIDRARQGMSEEVGQQERQAYLEDFVQEVSRRG